MSSPTTLSQRKLCAMNDDSLNTVPWIFTSFPSEAYKKEVGSALLDYVQGDKKWADVEKSITEKWKSERA